MPKKSKKKPAIKFLNAGRIPCNIHLKAPHHTENADGLVIFQDIDAFINPKLEEKRLLSTIVHECAHMFFPSATEKEITKFGNTVAKIVYQLGWKRTNSK